MPFPIEEAEIHETEKELGLLLPRSYVERMSANNGGEVEAGDDSWELHPLRDASDAKRLARTCNHVLRETEEMKTWARWPRGALAIGANGTGDCLVFVPDQNRARFAESVFLWNHETGELALVAEDFGRLKPA